MEDLDLCKDILALDLPQERLQEVVAAYRDILAQVNKLRTLDLTDTHPAILAGKISSVALTEACLDRIENIDGKLDSFKVMATAIPGY